MRIISLMAISFLLFVGSVLANTPLTFRQKAAFEKGVILESMYKAKTWQEAQHDGPVPTNWLTGTLYTGVFACYKATGKTEFLDASRNWCEAAEWKCGEKRPLHADDICSAQTFLDVYSEDKDPAQIKHIKNLIETYYFDQETIDRKLIGHATWKGDSHPFVGRDLWWWCDALYMAPPLFARLGYQTGDQRYYDLLHKLYWDATDFLYDEDEKLFYRDINAFDKLTPNGKKYFWSRGNGWVVGGLVRTIDYLKKDDPQLEKYIKLFQDMMLRLAALQKEDGTWSSSVNDIDWYPEPESSASAFYTYAMAAGINRGWLKPEIYIPHLVKAWEGLLMCLREDGKLEWAQIVDHQPNQVRHEDHKNYAQGAFLLAAAEVYKLDLTADKYNAYVNNKRIVKLAEQGAWTWYNDERVVFWNNHLVVGNMDNEGVSNVSINLLPGERHAIRRMAYPLSSWKQKDDHNNPALLPLDKDNLLAVYARHNTNKEFNVRTITRGRSSFDLGEERSVSHKGKVTYANLYRLENENGKIYNFFRGNGWNPNVVTSTDNGQTWSDPTMIFLSGDNSTRPYVKYASDNKNRIDLFYTDGHPRNEKKNNVYHAYYEKGNFYKSNGKKIRSLEQIKEKPLVPADGSLIFDGSGDAGRGWVHDIERGDNGELAGAFISSPDGDEGADLRYWYARFDANKKKWDAHEVGFAGPNLYVPENHYAGGVCVDPDNINVLYLSSNLDPKTGKPNGTGHYQIYKAETFDKGVTWEFVQLTFDVNNDNLRPVVPRNKPAKIEECIVWFRGEYNTYKKYNCEIVGYISNPVRGTDARYVAERMDDFAWENDLIAFRAYGPKLRSGAEDAGIDCWLKRVKYPIVEKWYNEALLVGKSYHVEHGEGHDSYHVGYSAGTGGTGLWIDGERRPLDAYVKYEINKDTKQEQVFTLFYENEIDGVEYKEEKTITIGLGTRLFSAKSKFYKDGKIATNLPICIGLTTHDQKAKPYSNKKKGWIAAWEAFSGSELGTAVKVAPEDVETIKTVKSDEKDRSHIFVIVNTDEDGCIEYQAGFGWKKAGEITTPKEWEAYLNQ